MTHEPGYEAVEDVELVRRALDGDERALDELVVRHHGAVFRVAVSILEDEDEAADATQETFVKAVEALPGFRGDAAFRTWLLTIAANRAKGMLRARARRRESPLDERPPVPAGGPDAARRAVLRDEARRARACLARLPEKQRLAVQLRVDEGLSFREVGEIIDSSEGAARVNYHHGIRRLREMLDT